MVSEDKLGPDQREILNEISKDWQNTWIKGHAGSGKSVLLIHLLRDYLAKNPNARVCVVGFTHALLDLMRTGIEELNLPKHKIPVTTMHGFTGKPNEYAAIFCDEFQDMPLKFVNIMTIRTNLIISAGDTEQSIYYKIPKFGLPPAKESEIINSIQSKRHELTYIYRLTDSMIELLGNVFPSIKQGKPNVEKNDTDIRYKTFNSLEQEREYVWKEAQKINSSDDMVAILFPEREQIKGFCEWINFKNGYDPIPKIILKNFDLLNSYFEENNIPLMYIGSGHGSLQQADKDNKIVLMTYHSSKGLDYEHVFVPFITEDLDVGKHGHPDRVLFVAFSRAKQNLYITYTGKINKNAAKFVKHLKADNIDNKKIKKRIEV